MKPGDYVVHIDHGIGTYNGLTLVHEKECMVLLYQGGTETHIGQPTVEGARVLAEVVDHPSIKLYIQHFRRRKNYRRFRGHRQPYTRLRIRSAVTALPRASVPARITPNSSPP